MLLTDVDLLVCTACGGDLHVATTTQGAGLLVIDGILACRSCANTYPVRRGVARFLDADSGYNPSWNYKWTAIDRGRALNHRVIDKGDPAYSLHDIYDRNSHDGRAYEHMRGKQTIEIGCGVGQYVLKSLLDYAPAKIVAYDLTESIDTLRDVVARQYPQFLDRILFVQGSVFSMPFRPGTFDYVYSLGVLHHTGRTEKAIRAAASLVKDGGQLNFWIYAAALYYIDTREPERRHLSRWWPLLRICHVRLQARAWYSLFAHLTPAQSDRVLRLFSSEIWFKLSRVPVVRILPRLIMSPPPHPDRDYRHINLFDGYVNNWAENWSEAELFPVLRDCGIVVKGISEWRVGFWGVRDQAYYNGSGDVSRG